MNYFQELYLKSYPIQNDVIVKLIKYDLYNIIMIAKFDQPQGNTELNAVIGAITKDEFIANSKPTKAMDSITQVVFSNTI